MTVNRMLMTFDDYAHLMFSKMKTDEKLKEAMMYSYFSGGKRIRPLFVFATASMKNSNVEVFYPLAFAIELVHTYSLIHDDLPAMDDDNLRRGKPTNHIVFGEDVAILAGDALLSESFNQLMNLNFPAEKLLSLVSTFSQSIGISGMVEGQVLDMRLENQKDATITIENLAEIHQLKTGKLFDLSMLETGKLLDLSKKETLLLEEFSTLIGKLFQAIDDYLDDEIGTGKTQGSDLKNMKPTYLSLLGKKDLKILLFDWQAKAQEILLSLAELGNNVEMLEKLLEMMLEKVAK